MDILGFLFGGLVGGVATLVVTGMSKRAASANATAGPSGERTRLDAELADLRHRLTVAEEARATAEADVAMGRPAAAPAPALAKASAPAPTPETSPPPSDAPDDLTRIKGIGPVLRDKLNGLGIESYRQIAEMTAADIARIDESLNLRGRIERETWVAQARALIGR